MPSSHLILCRPLLLLSPPSVFPSIRVFSNESGLRIRWPEYWSFRFSLLMNIQDWFPLGMTGLISLQSSEHSRVFSSTTIQKHQLFPTQPFFMVKLSYLYITTGKTIALNIQTFVRKVISLLFKMLSKFVIAFLSKARHLLISWLQSLSSDFGTQENKVCHCFHCLPSYLPWSDGTGCHDLCFLNVEF